MMADLRFALRTFRRSPGLIAAAVLATALGVGANTAIFQRDSGGAVAALALPRLRAPGDDLGEESRFQRLSGRRLPVAGRNYVEWKRQAHSFSGMAAMQQVRVQLTGTDRPEDLEAVRITPDFLPVLGRTPLLGRSFTPEKSAGKDQVALVSYAFFQRRFGGDPQRLGRTIQLAGKSRTP
jgi:putative ABC transport system permease protein